MTLHLLKNPVPPLAVQVLKAEASHAATPPVVVFLSAARDLSEVHGIEMYHVTDSPHGHGRAISYSRLVDLIFNAEKVVAW